MADGCDAAVESSAANLTSTRSSDLHANTEGGSLAAQEGGSVSNDGTVCDAAVDSSAANLTSTSSPHTACATVSNCNTAAEGDDAYATVLENYSCQELADFIAKKVNEEVGEAIRENRINGKLFLLLNEDNIKELVPKTLGDRLALLQILKDHRPATDDIGQQAKISPSAPITLSKKELYEKVKTDPSAHCALKTWNALNRTVRRAVIATKWKGDGSLSASKHTTPKEALKNQAKRDQILDNPKVKSLYHNFTIEDGSKVTIDHNIASTHIRQVLNDMKRSRNHEPNLHVPQTKESQEVYSPQSGYSSEDTEDMESDDGDSDSEPEPIPIKKAKLSKPERRIPIEKKSRSDKDISEGVKHSMDLIKKLKARQEKKKSY